MPSADEIRDEQLATWAGLSAGWEKWDSVIMDQLGPVSAAIIERLDIAEDHQHLDIAAPSLPIWTTRDAVRWGALRGPQRAIQTARSNGEASLRSAGSRSRQRLEL
jgi:hypothetical protein